MPSTLSYRTEPRDVECHGAIKKSRLPRAFIGGQRRFIMAKRKKSVGQKNGNRGPDFFVPAENPRRRSLILPRYLKEEADKAIYRGTRQDRAYEIVQKWADLESQGHLDQKETAIDADFLAEVFGEALGYPSLTESPEKYARQRNLTVPGVGTADGALGEFSPANPSSPTAVIELKGASADLDRDKFNGRTAVQQCWDYLNALPDCPWGIVSNFSSIRLYHRAKTPLAYQEFRLQELRKHEVFLQFYCLFEYGGLLPSLHGAPRALRLLERTEERRREVGDHLYEAYSENRSRLIEHLHRQHGKPVDEAIRIAQKILDRIIFVAFCEDRGLLPERCIERAWKEVPPFSRVTNPRWQNFLGLFQAIDRGDPENLKLEKGYNGGLFKKDSAVDDLQLDDSWTSFFRTVGDYDFRDEVNVEVLGHLFEKSVSELEQLRQGGYFQAGNGNGTEPAMPKSPERKRFGIYYTPPQFTQFIVKRTVVALANERFKELRGKHRLKPEALQTDQPSAALAAYWRDCWQVLRQIKICDPACGSGAFLIQAYDLLEESYNDIAEQLRFHLAPEADEWAEAIPDLILADNLHGVDLSEQAVEITQLALWIRSARRERTLADLSHNIVWGNSLVSDSAVHPRALDWKAAFPAVFDRPAAGFDCVIGNPPWERLKLQEREFFAFSAPAIAGAVSAARRRELIAELQAKNPELFARYTQAKETAERTLGHVRASGQFPLTATGDINTYMLFAELARRIVAPNGRSGLLVPSGIATDNTTRGFFTELMASKALLALFDFENRLRVFPDVDGRFKFCVLLFGGSDTKAAQADFVFFAHRMEDLNEKNRHIALSNADLALLNPNTRTCPIFRSRRDAELTKAIYRRVPILLDESREEGGNPWGIRYVRMFDQTNDAELFHTADQLRKLGFRAAGNRWTKKGRTFLPLYEAKMVQAYDHRAASVVVAAANWVRQGQTEETTLVSHQNPEFTAQPRWWVEDGEVDRVLAGKLKPAYLCYKDVTSATNERTMIAAFIPHVAVVNSAPVMLIGENVSPRNSCCLLGNLNSVVLDFMARQKVGGNHLNFFVVNQLPIFPPDRYAQRCPWQKRQTLEKWISDRVLKLTCTANDMQPLAEAAGFDPPVHKWDPAERLQLLAELDAAFFLLYGLDRDEMEYVLGTFTGLDRAEDMMPGMPSHGAAIRTAYERLAELAGRES